MCVYVCMYAYVDICILVTVYTYILVKELSHYFKIRGMGGENHTISIKITLTFSGKSEMKMLLSHDKFREPFFQGSFVDSSK